MDFSAGKWAERCGVNAKWKSSMQSSGNMAFEEYKARELERIEAERRKLMQDQQDFAEFVNDVRMSKDRAEFDSFMAARHSQSSAPSGQ